MRSQLSLRLLPSLLVVGLLGTGCSFQITETLPTQTIKALQVTGSEVAPLAQLNTQLPTLQAMNIGPQDTGPASSAELTSVTFNSTNGQTFDFLSALQVTVSSPGQPDLVIASLSPVPTGVTTIELSVDQTANVLPYLQAGCTLTASATGTYPTQDFSFDGVAVATIGVGT